MVAKENQIFGAAIQFCQSFTELIPEAVILGYSKLLSMDEGQVKSFVPDECMDDFEAAIKWFSDNKLDLSLIKSGFMFISPLIPRDEHKDNVEKFTKYLETEEKNVSSADILSKAVELAYVPILKVFAEGNEISDVFSYQAELRKKRSSEKTSDSNKEEQDKNNSEESDNDSESAQTKNYDIGELSKRYRKLNAALMDVVKGQDQAVFKFIQGYNQGELLKQTGRENRPRTYFFFFGPPGVGKTLLAETASKSLDIPYKIFNMSEFSGGQSHEELIGTPTIYKNAKEGSLVKYVRENPECMLVFDEIEKAHINVIRLFLQVLGSGKLHNVYKDVDTSFKDTTIIFTSNVGKELYEDRSVNLTMLPEKVIVDAIQKEKDAFDNPVFPTEICSRIASGNTIMFNHLSIRHIADMVRSNFDAIVEGMEREHAIQLTYAKELPLLFLFNRGGEIDARIAVGQSEKFIKDEIYELLRQMENSKSDVLKINELKLDIEWEGMDAELKRLFKNSESSEVIIFSDRTELFSSISPEHCRLNVTSSATEAGELLKKDITAVFIDPFCGALQDSESVLSISDYNTEGIRFLHSITETDAGVPVYLLEIDSQFSEVDRKTLILEGASGTMSVDTQHIESFKRQFSQTLEEIYMEKESVDFSQRGWVIDFNSKQEMDESTGKAKIVFYDLKKRMAVDVESRGSILSDVERPNIGFSDVIGAEKAKEELGYFVKYLQNPKKYVSAGEKPPQGILLYGPPGTGKTMLAKAMAGESDVTFIQTSATEFKNKYAGESEANIRRVFAKAKKYAPAIIFIDEIDAIGKQRTGSETTAHTESMLNALLTEMEGFESQDMKKPVFVLAATNFGVGAEKDGISGLDTALVRRFDNKIYVDLPNESERKEYILRMLQKKGIDTISDETAQNVAERTTGQSLAILQKVLELAIRNAERQSETVSDGNLLTALEEYIYGEKKDHTPEYYKEVAVHETGHAYLAYISGDKPSYITIESRGDFGGYMQHSNQEEVTGYTREEILSRIRTSLAGRAAEQVFFGKEKSLNTGASSDLKQATEWAWRMVCAYGMDGDQLIVLSKDDVLRSSMASDYVRRINEILNAEMQNTIEIVEKNKDKIKYISDMLIRENRLTGAQFEELMEN